MNRLAQEKSPYLLQHKDNPVDWYPWCSEAFDKAKREDKPVFLSVGYSTCHWCHVMAHESFADEEAAAVLNKNFVCIKVDREERPDIDAVYMKVCQALTGSGGWPMTVFMTPEQKPFFAGTYFPKPAVTVSRGSSSCQTGSHSFGKPTATGLSAPASRSPQPSFHSPGKTLRRTGSCCSGRMKVCAAALTANGAASAPRQSSPRRTISSFSCSAEIPK